jgi:hypothetical protein
MAEMKQAEHIGIIKKNVDIKKDLNMHPTMEFKED